MKVTFSLLVLFSVHSLRRIFLNEDSLIEIKFFQVDLGDQILLSKWKQWWVDSQWEVLKSNEKVRIMF